MSYCPDTIICVSDGKTNKNIGYIELKIEYLLGYPIDVTFRAYPKNVWIVYNDDRNNPSSGVDLLDCWLAPDVLFDKVPKSRFALKPQIIRLCNTLNLSSVFLEQGIDELVKKAGELEREFLSRKEG